MNDQKRSSSFLNTYKRNFFLIKDQKTVITFIRQKMKWAVCKLSAVAAGGPTTWTSTYALESTNWFVVVSKRGHTVTTFSHCHYLFTQEGTHCHYLFTLSLPFHTRGDTLSLPFHTRGDTLSLPFHTRGDTLSRPFHTVTTFSHKRGHTVTTFSQIWTKTKLFAVAPNQQYNWIRLTILRDLFL